MNRYINRKSIILVALIALLILVVTLIINFVNSFSTVTIKSDANGTLMLEDDSHDIQRGKTSLPWIKKDTYQYKFTSEDIILFGTIDTRFEENITFNTKMYKRDFILNTIYRTFDHIDIPFEEFIEQYKTTYALYENNQWLVAKVVLDEQSNSNIWLILRAEERDWNLVTRTSTTVKEDGGYSIPPDVLTSVNKEVNDD